MGQWCGSGLYGRTDGLSGWVAHLGVHTPPHHTTPHHNTLLKAQSWHAGVSQGPRSRKGARKQCVIRGLSEESGVRCSEEGFFMEGTLRMLVLVLTHRCAFHLRDFSHAGVTTVALSHTSTHQPRASLMLTSSPAAHSSERGGSDSGLLLAEYKRCHAASLYLQMFLNPLD